MSKKVYDVAESVSVMPQRKCVHFNGTDPCGWHPWDIDCSNDDPIVKQEFKDDCDVNLIIERCLRNGAALPNYEHIAPVFADVTEVGDFRDMITRLDAAQNAFMDLPAQVRSRFSNDPAQLIDFLANAENRDEAIKLGLIKAPTPEEIAAAEAKGSPEPKPKTKPKAESD